jgi:hypothetical protein
MDSRLPLHPSHFSWRIMEQESSAACSGNTNPGRLKSGG